MYNAYVRQIYRFIAFFGLFLTFNSYNLNIIFDLGDVIVETDKRAAFKQMGYSNFLQYASSHFRQLFSLSSHIRYETFFRLMNAAEQSSAESTLLASSRDEDGVIIPPIMRRWLAGTLASKDILDVLIKFSDNNSHHFRNTSEKQLALAMIGAIFTPELFVQTRVLNKNAVALVRKCHAQGHSLYILSNWDRESFELLRRKNPVFFNLFKGIVISGEVGALKPDHAPYHTLIKKYNLDTSKSVFIDDRLENIATAQSLGIAGIVCTKKRIPFMPWKKEIDIVLVEKNLQKIKNRHSKSMITC